jgi:hypothetical protein
VRTNRSGQILYGCFTRHDTYGVFVTNPSVAITRAVEDSERTRFNCQNRSQFSRQGTLLQSRNMASRTKRTVPHFFAGSVSSLGIQYASWPLIPAFLVTLLTCSATLPGKLPCMEKSTGMKAGLKSAGSVAGTLNVPWRHGTMRPSGSSNAPLRSTVDPDSPLKPLDLEAEKSYCNDTPGPAYTVTRSNLCTRSPSYSTGMSRPAYTVLPKMRYACGHSCESVPL